MFAFAGLWEAWKDKTTDRLLQTYAIITTDPNEIMEPIHRHMPPILAVNDNDRRMEPAKPSHLPVYMLKPYPAEEMKARKVSSAGGNVRNNNALLIVGYDLGCLANQ